MADENNTDRDFDELLAMMKESRGFDFTGYKRSTLERRINRRIAFPPTPPARTTMPTCWRAT